MSHRFYIVPPDASGRVTLVGPEAHHLQHVMRAQVGQRVALFDGSGAEFVAEVVAGRRGSVDLQIIERHEVDRELPFSLVVGVALPKGDRQKWLVEKLTELGVSALVPLATERGVAQPTAGALRRLERAVIEAAKQCGRNRLMRVESPQVWQEWLTGHAAGDDPRRLVAHPGGRAVAELNLTSPQPTYLAIGSEGGLTDEELAAAVAAGWQAVDLGPRILRVETAAVALVAAAVLAAR